MQYLTKRSLPVYFNLAPSMSITQITRSREHYIADHLLLLPPIKLPHPSQITFQHLLDNSITRNVARHKLAE